MPNWWRWPTFQILSFYDVPKEHPKLLLEFGCTPKESETKLKSAKSDATSFGEGEGGDSNSVIRWRKSKALQSWDDMLCRKLKYTKEAVLAKQRRHDIQQAKHKFNLFICTINESDEVACE